MGFLLWIIIFMNGILDGGKNAEMLPSSVWYLENNTWGLYIGRECSLNLALMHRLMDSGFLLWIILINKGLDGG